MNALRPERSIVVLLLALATVIIAVGGTIWLYRSQQAEIGWVNHTLRVENRLSVILSRVQAAESAQRGYMLTRQDPFWGRSTRSRRTGRARSRNCAPMCRTMRTKLRPSMRWGGCSASD